MRTRSFGLPQTPFALAVFPGKLAIVADCAFHNPVQIVSLAHKVQVRDNPDEIGIMALNAPDLTKRPPRSPRVRLGGFVILPRLLDKGRATLAGKHGEYDYACPLDQRWFGFTGISAEALKRQLKAGKSDGEILAWVNANLKPRRTASEIEAWSAWQERRAPDNPDSRGFFNELHTKAAPDREDIVTWFDLLDVDDYVSFGGNA